MDTLNHPQVQLLRVDGRISRKDSVGQMLKAVTAMFLNLLQAMGVGMERTRVGGTNQLVDLVTLVTDLVHIHSKRTILG